MRPKLAGSVGQQAQHVSWMVPLISVAQLYSRLNWITEVPDSASIPETAEDISEVFKGAEQNLKVSKRRSMEALLALLDVSRAVFVFSALVMV